MLYENAAAARQLVIRCVFPTDAAFLNDDVGTILVMNGGPAVSIESISIRFGRSSLRNGVPRRDGSTMSVVCYFRCCRRGGGSTETAIIIPTVAGVVIAAIIVATIDAATVTAGACCVIFCVITGRC